MINENIEIESKNLLTALEDQEGMKLLLKINNFLERRGNDGFIDLIRADLVKNLNEIILKSG